MKTKNGIWIYSLLILGVLLMLENGCSQDDPDAPALTTAAATDIGQTTALSGGNVTSDGGDAVTARGVCWSTDVEPTIKDSKTTDGTGQGNFTSSITGLLPTTIYHVRAYATNSAGTGYGTDKSFTTGIEIEGTVYHPVTIGSQVWMVENLNVTTYRNGDPIPNVADQVTWADLTTGGYCNVSSDASNSNLYGRLYNWYAVNDNRNIAPVGWHIPTDNEWSTLIASVGGQSIAGAKMKDVGSGHWCNPNSGATNESGFTALPGGIRTDLYLLPGCNWGSWWSSTEHETEITKAYNRIIFDNESVVNRVSNNKKFGFSVRCIKD